jgi:hypothetical protein
VNENAPWLELNANSGLTPGELSLTVDFSTLPPGQQWTQISLTSPDVPGQTELVNVYADSLIRPLFLPIVVR